MASTGADVGPAFSHFGAVTRNVTINGRSATVPALILKLSDASRIAKVCDAIPELSGHDLSDGYGCTSNPMAEGPL